MTVKLSESSKTQTEKLEVRRPVVDDFPAIREISNWAIRHTAAIFKTEPDTLEYWVDRWKSAGECYPWFVGVGNGSVIGFAMASPFHSRCAYAYTAEVTVYVDPAHQSKRVGHALYSQLIPTLKAQGYKTLVAGIAIPNAASERLHARFNFQKIGVLERVGWKLGQWHDVGHWQLVLIEGNDDPTPIKKVCEVRNDSDETPGPPTALGEG